MKWISLIFLSFLLIGQALCEPPSVMLAHVWESDRPVSEYWVSEKLDGVRARWDGERLISRGGKVFAAPKWFTQDLPPLVLDGELWSEGLGYQRISSITSRQTPHAGWKAIKLMVFDMPEVGGAFSRRVAAMDQLPTSRHLDVIEQRRVASLIELSQRLTEITERGGEGLMLHHQAAIYKAGRSRDLLKLKPYQDAEAIVIAYRAGKGKYRDLVGALHVENEAGKTFYVGSGLTDAQRRQPPEIGATITYRHQGFTDAGLPRFPVFLRIRQE